MFFRLGRGCAAEARGASCGTADASGAGDEFEQVKGDVFVAAGAKPCGIERVHAEMFSEKDANRKHVLAARPERRRTKRDSLE